MQELLSMMKCPPPPFLPKSHFSHHHEALSTKDAGARVKWRAILRQQLKRHNQRLGRSQLNLHGFGVNLLVQSVVRLENDKGRGCSTEWHSGPALAFGFGLVGERRGTRKTNESAVAAK